MLFQASGSEYSGSFLNISIRGKGSIILYGLSLGVILERRSRLHRSGDPRLGSGPGGPQVFAFS
jgi:hypothetical protein